MLTYTATNQKTGKFYIGSAKDYCNYMNRKGNHHVGRPYNDFRKDLQADPLAFTWDYSEDDSDSREFEEALLHLYVGNFRCYNKAKTSKGCVGDPDTTYRGGRTVGAHSEETRQKMSESARSEKAQPPHKKAAQSRAVSQTNSKKQPCPQCGMLMNVGNLTKHLKGTRCKAKLPG